MAVLCMTAVGIGVYLAWPKPAAVRTDVLITIESRNLPPGLMHGDWSAGGIEFHLSGPDSLIGKCDFDSFRYVIDMSNVKPGVLTFPVDKDKIQFPEGISVVGVSPAHVTTRVAYSETKELTVSVNIKGKPAFGYHVVNLKADPATVMVSGPRSLLRTLTHVNTKPLDISDVSEPIKRETILNLPEDLELAGPRKIIRVDIEITEKMILKQLDDLQIRGNTAGYAYAIEPDHLDLAVKGSERFFSTRDFKKDIDVSVDLENLEPGVYHLPAVIRLPMNLTLASVTPKTFKVTVFDRPLNEN